MKYKYVYGPVTSRRLKRSLGIDIVPFKKCSFNCIYCQLGKSARTTIARSSFYPIEDILEEVSQAIKKHRNIDYLTFSGSGEPTLNKDIGFLIKSIKEITDIPVAVLTNTSLLNIKSVRDQLRSADVVAPSLDAADPKTYKRINRPYEGLELRKILSGLITFSREFKGQLWLEIMLIKGINDSIESLRGFKKLIKKIKPARVHLNTVVRLPAETYARPLSLAEMQLAKRIIGQKAEIISVRKSFRKGLARGIEGIRRGIAE